MKLWWDKGILWISVNQHGIIAVNSYEALDLLQKLEEKLDEIETQARADIAEGYYRELNEVTRP